MNESIFKDETPKLKLTPGICFDMSYENCVKESQGKMNHQYMEKFLNKCTAITEKDLKAIGEPTAFLYENLDILHEEA